MPSTASRRQRCSDVRVGQGLSGLAVASKQPTCLWGRQQRNLSLPPGK